jgi:hypothetical protein
MAEAGIVRLPSIPSSQRQPGNASTAHPADVTAAEVATGTTARSLVPKEPSPPVANTREQTALPKQSDTSAVQAEGSTAQTVIELIENPPVSRAEGDAASVRLERASRPLLRHKGGRPFHKARAPVIEELERLKHSDEGLPPRTLIMGRVKARLNRLQIQPAADSAMRAWIRPYYSSGKRTDKHRQ